MSKISKVVKVDKEKNELRLSETVTNFMGGDSYVINPLDTLKIVTSSSIFGEASYYRNGSFGTKKVLDATYRICKCLPKEEFVITDENMTTPEIMEKVIDESLSFDFKGTLDWAVELRNEFNMRLNPQVIMVRAAIHPDRQVFTEMNPGAFAEYEKNVMRRADEPMSQIAYYLYKKGSKANMPTILKKSLAKKLSGLSKYEIGKYKNHEIGMVDAVRITHANSEYLNDLMKGDFSVDEDQKTWENLRSAGQDWKTIFNSVNMGHMALLRNLRGVFTEVNDLDFCKEYLAKLKEGVLGGKQFPFRYYNAYMMIEKSGCNHKALILDALEECLDISVDNMPKLKGRTMCLSDNSGSAWGAFNSEYGKVTIAEIDNLSSVITAISSDEGYVGKFGDELKEISIRKRNGILSQAKSISNKGCNDVGGSTEGGIWKFFNKAIENKEHWDNIFIYSDQQAGHGGLYGTSIDEKQYSKEYSVNGRMINVYKLINEYRKRVNPKVNVYTVQTAGYNNVLVPENSYRVSILYGWSGKEQVYAAKLNKIWDQIDEKNKK